MSAAEFKEVVRRGLERADLEGKRVLVILPDRTRTAPIPLCFRVFYETLYENVAQLDFLIALGTHPPLSEEEIESHLGVRPGELKSLNIKVFNHVWDDPEKLRRIGVISTTEMEKISRGLLIEEVPVEINRRIFDYDHLIIVGPVFPHEVVGFSGGLKYFFPGISGPAMVHYSHWLGALITNPKIDGTKWTPVRELIHRAASFVEIPTTLFALVMQRHDIHGLYVGNPIAAWETAADLSAKVNIVWVEYPFHTVLSVAPLMYKDLWTAGKCVYKLEPVVEDGGRIIVYGPHIKEVSYTHGRLIRKIGYHTRDYFLKQWDKFKEIPAAILAHSTHVKGIGTYIDGVEHPRIEVILATGISEKVCKEINLGYLNLDEINLEDYTGREDEGVLLVPEAGEMLYRLTDGTVPEIENLYTEEERECQ